MNRKGKEGEREGKEKGKDIYIIYIYYMYIVMVDLVVDVVIWSFCVHDHVCIMCIIMYV